MSCLVLIVLAQFHSSHLLRLFQVDTFNRRQNLLTNVVNLSASYLRVLFLVLKRSLNLRLAEGRSGPHLQSVQFDECLNWCESCLTHKHPQTGATPLLRLFDFFSSKLTTAENFVAAFNILEILSLLAFFDKDELLSRVVELSWTSLHTVYDAEVTTKSSCPYAVTVWHLRFGKDACMQDHQPVVRIVNRILSKQLQRENKNIPEFVCLQFGLIRHFGLLTTSKVGLSFLIKHLSSLISSLKSLVESLDVAFFSNRTDDEEKNSETMHSKKRKTCHTSSVYGLEVATIADYFDTLLNLAVATVGALNPGEPMNGSISSPYQVFEECYGLYRNVIELYQASIFAFPRKSAATVTCASKDMLSIAFHQLQRCIDWRNQQPILSNQERSSGKLDMGSIRYLQQLIDTIMSHTAVPILRLCDLWQSSTTVGFMKVSRIASVRLMVEKAMQRIKDVALSHNLSTSSFIQCDEIKNDEPTKGFHILSRKEDEHTPGMHETNDPLPAKQFTMDVESDTDDSFGVIGQWGDESDSNSDNNSACTLNLDNSSASLPRKSL
jgi:hypothetical protein